MFSYSGERKAVWADFEPCLCNYQLDFISQRNNKSLGCVVEDLDLAAAHEQGVVSVPQPQCDTVRGSVEQFHVLCIV